MNKRLLAWCILTGAAAVAPAFAQSEAANRMLRDKGCLECHAWERQLVGPALNHVRARYEIGDFFSFLVERVRNGGSGSWGSVPMPAHPQISQTEAEFLVASIMEFKGYAAPPRAVSVADAPPSVGKVFRLR